MGPFRFVGFCFALFAAFGAGYYYNGIANHDTSLVYASPSHIGIAPRAGVEAGVSNEYCAILTMPRSYIPFLERFKNHQLARDIKITPAIMENDGGRVTVTPKDDAPQEPTGAEAANPEPADSQETASAIADGSTPPPENASVFGAVAVYFLAGARPLQNGE